MSTLAIIGLVLLVLVILCGTVIKLKMRRQLQDIDGLDSALITRDGEVDRFVNARTEELF